MTHETRPVVTSRVKDYTGPCSAREIGVRVLLALRKPGPHPSEPYADVRAKWSPKGIMLPSEGAGTDRLPNAPRVMIDGAFTLVLEVQARSWGYWYDLRARCEDTLAIQAIASVRSQRHAWALWEVFGGRPMTAEERKVAMHSAGVTYHRGRPAERSCPHCGAAL